jgi:hypothetical protein
MELEVIKKVKVNPKTLFVYIPDYEDVVFEGITYHDIPMVFEGKEYNSIEAIKNDYPSLFCKNTRDEDCFKIEIDVVTGQVVNWPKNSQFDFYDAKIVDTGEYTLLDRNCDVIVNYAGYVPACVGPDGWGDYLEFEIDSDSNIPGWEFTQAHLNELMKESGDELYENI